MLRFERTAVTSFSVHVAGVRGIIMLNAVPHNDSLLFVVVQTPFMTVRRFQQASKKPHQCSVVIVLLL